MRYVLLTLLFSCTLTLPWTTVQAASVVDLSIASKDITFSKDPLVAGDRVRLYAIVKNPGDEDVSGYVSFFQGSTPVGDSQVISVRANGTPEEVYVDFTVPSGAFNIRAEIRATDPADEQPSNNVAITKLYTPITDDDRDGVANEGDNCPTSKNTNQLDTDNDGEGDVCDADDDNDGLSDEVEKELGTSLVQKDTDGDGVNDPSDAYPLDSTKTKEPPPAPVVVPKPTPTPAVVTKPAASPTTPPSPVAAVPVPIESIPTPSEEPLPEPVSESSLDYAGAISLGAVFSYTRTDWNAFRFDVLAPLREGERLEWDFGDGATSGLRTADHTYRSPGSYTVRVRRITADGAVSEDTAEVDVPFFTLNNRLVLAAVGILILALLSGALAAFRLRGARASKKTMEEI